MYIYIYIWFICVSFVTYCNNEIYRLFVNLGEWEADIKKWRRMAFQLTAPVQLHMTGDKQYI